MSVSPVPAGFHSITPYLIVHDAAAAIDFYRRAFGATEVMRLGGPNGKVMHAEMKIGDSHIMLADEFPEMDVRGPLSRGGSSLSLLLYLPNVDAAFARALAEGAKEVRPLKDQFYGDRSGTVVDPFGHVWSLATHVEDVSPEEIDRRFAAFATKQQ